MTLAQELILSSAKYRYDATGFARLIIPWRRPPYQQWTDLWPWHKTFFDGVSREAYQKRFGPDADGMVTPREPILRAISSGTGTGKSSLIMPVMVFWTMSVFQALRGLAISASRENIGDKLFKDCKALIEASPFLKRYFESTADGTIWIKGDREASNFTFRTSDNVAALSGTHALGHITCVLFEESAGISDKSFSATQGARNDTQNISLACGQCLHLSGTFYRMCFGDMAQDWNPIVVSSGDMPNATPEMRARRARECGGEDTDDFRTLFEGLPPQYATDAFLSRSSLDEAAARPLRDAAGRPLIAHDTPVVAGLDLARSGAEGGSLNVMAFRAGLDGRSIKPAIMPGHQLEPRDRADWAIHEATRVHPPYGRAAVVYYDATGLDGLFAEALRERGAGDLFHPINFGARSPNERFANYRGAMYNEFARWLYLGAILPRDEALLRALNAARREYDKNERGRVLITAKSEIKKEVGAEKLDLVDAMLLYTHKPPVTAETIKKRFRRRPPPHRHWQA